MRHVKLRSVAEMPVVTDASDESMLTAYAVRLGSALSATICGRCRAAARETGRGAQM